jgi:hypothetical protein
MTTAVPRRPAVPARRSTVGANAGTGGPSVWLLAGLFALFLGLPIITLIARAFLDGSLIAVAGTSPVLAALALSLTTTAISLVLTVAIGLPLAIVLARRTFRGKWLVEALVDLPIVLPARGRRPCAPACVRSPRSARRPAPGRRAGHRLHHLRRDPGADLRVGAVLRQGGTSRHRRGRPRPRGRRAGRWCDRATGLQVRDDPVGRRERSRPAS